MPPKGGFLCLRKRNMFTAKYLQQILGVEDNEIVLYGYTFNRNTVFVYFCKGNIIRVEEDLDEVVSFYSTNKIDSSIFYDYVKRWYSNGTNKILRELINSFSRDALCETSGGMYHAGEFIGYQQEENL